MEVVGGGVAIVVGVLGLRLKLKGLSIKEFFRVGGDC